MKTVEDIVNRGDCLSRGKKASTSNMPYELNEFLDYLKEQGFSLFWQSFGNRGDCLQYWKRRMLLKTEYVEIHVFPDTPIIFWLRQVQVKDIELNLCYARRSFSNPFQP